MIKKITDMSDIRGSLPLVSVIQTDFCFVNNECDGVFCQEIDGKKTFVMSLRGCTATICKSEDYIDAEELSAFLKFHHVENILSDFELSGFLLESRTVLEMTPCNSPVSGSVFLTPESRLCDYKNVFELLCHNGKFDVWYPLFSRKVNKFCAFGSYEIQGSVPVSCALAPFVNNKVGIIAGVFTKENYRKKGYATNCVKALLSQMQKNGVQKAYLWCENKNIDLYKNIGFSVCGKIYVKREE